MDILHMTNENYHALVEAADRKVLVDFWATWCGPCQMLAPTLEEIAAENDSFYVAKIDVDQCPDLARKFGIASIPTLIVMEGGQPVAKMIGLRPKEDILKLVNG